jgi:hypothetical protein
VENVKSRQELIEEFIRISKEQISDFASRHDQKLNDIKAGVISLLTSLGVSEKLFKEAIKDNKKEVFESILGECVAVIAMVFAWKKEDKEAFSQALGEVGVAALFALNPLVAVIALATLAIRFQKLIHPEAIKKYARGLYRELFSGSNRCCSRQPPPKSRPTR